MIFKKRIVYFLVTFTVIACNLLYSNYAFASESGYESVDVDNYVDLVLNGYLKSNNQYADKVSYCIKVNGAEGEEAHYMAFVFNKENAVGYINIYYSGRLYSNYVSTNLSIKEGDSISVVLSDGELLYYENGTSVHIAGDNKSDRKHLDCVYSYDTITLRKIIISKPEAKSNPIYYYLSVPYVANASVNGKGLCWAACVAARKNYHSGTSLTAMNVYNACNSSTSSNRPSGTPSGSVAWIQFAYSMYNISTTYVSSGKTSAQIQNLLNNDKPIYCSLSRSGGSHAVLLMGIYLYGSSNIYMFRDPNESGVVSINVNSSVLTDPSLFVYTNSSYTYDNWYRSIY